MVQDIISIHGKLYKASENNNDVPSLLYEEKNIFITENWRKKNRTVLNSVLWLSTLYAPI